MGVSQEDYDLIAWENKNFAEYLENVLGCSQEIIEQIANGNIKGNK
tara:strand:+ start:1936 stop:2073 length:138 start_codon:yes stop_codon:yes gene_type:complete